MDAEAFDHTPLPWFIRDGQVWAPEGMIAQLQQRGGLLEVVAGDHVEYHLPEMEANGELIVRAVNSHDQLVEALEAMVREIDAHDAAAGISTSALVGAYFRREQVEIARAVLAAARGEAVDA